MLAGLIAQGSKTNFYSRQSVYNTGIRSKLDVCLMKRTFMVNMWGHICLVSYFPFACGTPWQSF